MVFLNHQSVLSLLGQNPEARCSSLYGLPLGALKEKAPKCHSFHQMSTKCKSKFLILYFLCFFWFLSPGNYSNYLGRNLSEAESSLSFRSALKLVGFYPFALSSCSHRGRSHKFCPIVMGKASHAESLVLCSAFLLASHFEANLLLQCHGRITFSCLVVFSR